MTMIRIVQSCVTGCGRTRVLHYPEGSQPPDFNWEADQAAMAQAQIDAAAQEIIRRRLQLRNDLEAIKANNPVWWLQVMG